MRRCGSPAMKCGPSSSAFHARSRAAIVPMAVLFATGSSTRHRSGNRASGLCCASKSLRAIPAFRSEMAPGRRWDSRAIVQRGSHRRSRRSDAWSLPCAVEGPCRLRTVSVSRPLLSPEIFRTDARLAGGRFQPHTIRDRAREEHERVGARLDLAANTPIFWMSVACVRHEARRQRNNITPDLSAAQRTVRLDILSRVCVVPVAPDVIADVSKPPGNVPVEVDEGYVEPLCQKSADRALAGSAGTDQSNHRAKVNNVTGDGLCPVCVRNRAHGHHRYRRRRTDLALLSFH